MLEIELYQIFLSLGRGRSRYEIKLKCDVTFILISRAAILLASSAGERDRGSVNEKCILLENTYSCILHIFYHDGPTPPSLSPHAVKEMQGTLGFWIPRRGFRIPCEWNFSLFSPGVQFAPSHNLNSQNRLVQLWIPESKSLWDSGFLEPSSGFQSPDFKFPNLHHLE